MSHDIEIQADGTASFVAAREPAWHKLGKVYEDQNGIDLETVLTDLNVGDLITEPVYGSKSLKTLAGKKLVTRKRKSPTGAAHYTPLGVVGDDYTVIDERTAFGFLDKVVDTGEAAFQTAMLLDGGKKAAAVMKFPTGVLIAGVDPIDLYALVTTSHDGRTSLTMAATPVRVVCQNTLTWGLDLAVQKWMVRHTKHASDKMKVEEARRGLDLSYAYLGEWAEEAEKLIDVEMTKLQFEEIVADLYLPDKAEPAKSTQTIWEGILAHHMQLWDSPTQDKIRDTAWGGLNALVEWHDWFRKVKQPGDDVTGYRFERALMEGASTGKTRIHDAVKQFAGV